MRNSTVRVVLSALLISTNPAFAAEPIVVPDTRELYIGHLRRAASPAECRFFGKASPLIAPYACDPDVPGWRETYFNQHLVGVPLNDGDTARIGRAIKLLAIGQHVGSLGYAMDMNQRRRGRNFRILFGPIEAAKDPIWTATDHRDLMTRFARMLKPLIRGELETHHVDVFGEQISIPYLVDKGFLRTADFDNQDPYEELAEKIVRDYMNSSITYTEFYAYDHDSVRPYIPWAIHELVARGVVTVSGDRRIQGAVGAYGSARAHSLVDGLKGLSPQIPTIPGWPATAPELTAPEPVAPRVASPAPQSP